ncbi:MAG: ATP-dependent DNA helicase UvrD2 [Actinomycetota bacterium]|nr:ATP-dependent DNA helicase UvrD2 [Actinomycetota bacterium]
MEFLDKNMTEKQFDAVRSDARHLRILAGAGTGKTRVLTQRIAYQINAVRIEPEHSLCLAFTNKAATEIKDRMTPMGEASSVETGTFHSIAYRQVKARWKDLGIRDEPDLISNQGSYLSRVLPKSLNHAERNFILTEINWATARRISVVDYISEAENAGRLDVVPLVSVSEYFQKYLELKRKENFIDFDDIIQLAIRFLAEDANYAEARHWKFKDLFVDEFQDVNPLQFALLQAWLGSSSSLTVVGDPCQAIYSWNGADARFLNDFEKYFPNSQTVILKDNFRSSPEILALSSSILPMMEHLDSKKQSGRLPTIRAELDEYEEARSVARLVKELAVGDIDLGDQAVLVRTHAQIPPIIEVFKEQEIKFMVASDTESGAGRDDGVQILTLHAAKGLEWKIVHLCGVEEGFHPISHADTELALEEERRLFFVGLTRAEEQLHISWARNRALGSKRSRKPSMYIRELSDLLDPTPLKFGGDRKALSQKIRAFLSYQSVTDHQPKVLYSEQSCMDELDSIRRNIAKANDSKPEIVLSDDAIAALVSLKPKSIKDLRKISQVSSAIIDRFGDQIIEIFS